jgi:hypothetical protein
MDKPVELQDILKDLIKGKGIVWDGAFCLYKDYDIVSVFGNDKITAVWIRQSMPDNREKLWLRPEEPDFLKQLEAAVVQAKKVIDDTEETKKALADFRNYITGSFIKPASGPVA